MQSNERAGWGEWGWRTAIFFAGVIVTLIGAFFANGASKLDIEHAVAAHREVNNEQFATVNVQLKAINERLVQMQAQIDRVGDAVGVGQEPARRKR